MYKFKQEYKSVEIVHKGVLINYINIDDESAKIILSIASVAHIIEKVDINSIMPKKKSK